MLEGTLKTRDGKLYVVCSTTLFEPDARGLRGAALARKGGRLRVLSGDSLLASYSAKSLGKGVSDFVEAFWFWKAGA